MNTYKQESKKLSLKFEDLDQFTGTENYYKHWLKGLYTDGVAFMAEKGGAFWLIDAVFSYRKKEPFQIWELKKTEFTEPQEEGPMAILTMKTDTNEPEIVQQEILYTDFPLDYIKLYLIDGVLLLPSEY